MDDTDLYRMVDEVLHYVWDPIGVSTEPRARDEYYAYVPSVFSLVRDDRNAREIAAHLRSIAVERIGLSAAPEAEANVARLLLEWKELIRSSRASSVTKLPPMPIDGK